MDTITQKNNHAYLPRIEGRLIEDWLNDIILRLNEVQPGQVYEVADLAQRDAIAQPAAGSVALISNVAGQPGISFYTGTNWTAAISGGGGIVGDTKLQDLSLTGQTLTATLSDGTTVPVDLSGLPDLINDADADPSGELQSLSLQDTDLSISQGNTIDVSSLINGVYEPADLTARDNLLNVNKSSVAIVANADGSGTPGISWWNGIRWTTPFLAGSSGGALRQKVTLSSGNLSVRLAYTGSAPTLQANATGDYSLIIPAGSEVLSLDISGDNTTLTGTGDFTFRLDNSANAEEVSFNSQLYNPGNGALVDVFAQGNNHARSYAGNVLTHNYPNMQLFGASGFDILLR
jgi:hypothetical protein